jgi:hypothetical protein
METWINQSNELIDPMTIYSLKFTWLLLDAISSSIQKQRSNLIHWLPRLTLLGNAFACFGTTMSNNGCAENNFSTHQSEHKNVIILFHSQELNFIVINLLQRHHSTSSKEPPP